MTEHVWLALLLLALLACRGVFDDGDLWEAEGTWQRA